MTRRLHDGTGEREQALCARCATVLERTGSIGKASVLAGRLMPL